MAAIPAHEQQADTPADVLAAVQAERATADQAEVRILQLALDWAAMHEIDPASLFKSERPILLAGTGTPEVGEYCVPEFAAALHISTDAGRCLIADAIELAHRLPRVWARVQAGKLPPWRARRISSSTFCLPPEGAEYVDRHVARFAHKVGIAQLDRLVEEALVRFDPEQAEERRLSAADNRHVTIYTDQTDFNGTAHIDADLDLADALDLDAALADGAARLAELGCEDSLDARRAHALGELARGTDPTLPLPAREVVLTVHVTEVAVTGDADGPHLARVENTRSFVSVDQVRTWCGTPGTTITVKPVIDFNEHLSGTAYETPDRLVEQSALVDETCVFPWCTRPARRTDCDHVIPHADGGSTCSCNIARLCRRHHRLKTHTAWDYVVLERGSYLWTSPHGYQFLRDRDGTLDVTPTDARRRSAEHGHIHLVPDP
nr:HNH endonuclease signature motif containing protein [uncultured Nocardioides sp.]